MLEIVPYTRQDGKVPFLLWQKGLRDRTAKAAIAQRLYRLLAGHFGDCKPCQDGVWELRINVGPGYRVYYARSGQQVIVLLGGGDKRTQQADIARACADWHDWQSRQKSPWR